MSNETKRDVFNDLVEQHQNYVITVVGDYGFKDKAIEGWNKRYSAALPDDMPVIPKTVGKYIKEAKFEDVTLLEALGCARDPVFKNLGRWITSHSEEFARAWVLGVWRVEETGEVVKL
ncbi:MAG: hypothetical protein L0K23_10005 [Lacticaseibacillus paracasei]|nr:hypothetical protein [Lacticaseibacillus paracasei]MDN6463447.1 hypothetical protein [Lacticaseibacillus paracasei]MDN6565345.1 hypothetical protein [Lacticaseibacillus paracasei]